MSKRIEEIKSRLEKATQGPWRQGDEEEGCENVIMDDGYWWSYSHIPLDNPPSNVRDAEFIAHAPEDLRYLLDQLELYRKAVEEDALLAKIREWKFHWMMKEPGYQERAFDIDANMIHDLARRLTTLLGGEGVV
jgi:hypothetical protein